MSAQEAKEVTLYSCPTGGWVMGNRFAMEDGIKAVAGKDCIVKHKVGMPLTAVVEVGGRSKRECAPLSMIAPCNVFGRFFSATSTGELAKDLLAQQYGAAHDVDASPSTAKAMER